METASIIIPSIGRKKSLKRCLDSIKKQTFLDYKVYVVNDARPLAYCRNKGAKLSKGKYLVFIDDDTYCTENWLMNIVKTFERSEKIGGVSGPAVITDEYKENRDLFRHRFLKHYLYDRFFCEGKEYLPGRLMSSGAFTTGSSDMNCSYIGEVDFTEACNMSFRRDAFNEAGGFSEEYGGVGEWQEPDLCFKIRQLGYKIWFNPLVKLYHEPSKSGIYKRRFKETNLRYQNYLIFSHKWIKPNWKHTLFKLFMRIFYAIKTAK